MTARVVVALALLAAAIAVALVTGDDPPSGVLAAAAPQAPEPTSVVPPAPATPSTSPVERAAATEAPPSTLVDPAPGVLRHVFAGRVVRVEDGAPIRDATVDVRGGRRTVRTDEDGRFVLRLAWHRYLLVTAPGRGPRLVVTDDGHAPPRPPREIRLADGGTVRLSLDDRRHRVGERWLVARTDTAALTPADEGPIPHLRRTEQSRAPVDDEGHAVLDALPSGAPIRLAIEEGTTVLAVLATDLVLRPGETRALHHRIDRGTRVTGRVVRALDGSVVADERVIVFEAPAAAPSLPVSYTRLDLPRPVPGGPRSSGVARASTDGDGVFHIADLRPGAYRIGAGRGRVISTQPLVIAPGTGHVDVTIRVPHLAVSGTVLRPDGTPAARILVGGIPRCGDVVLEGRTDDAGRFEIGPLWPGRVRLRAIGAGGLAGPAELEVDAGTSDVVLRLPAGAVLAGTVRDAATGIGVPATIRLTGADDREVSTRTGYDGSFELRGLGAGTTSLAATTDDGLAGIGPTVTLLAGDRRTGVDVAVARGAPLVVEVDRDALVRVAAGATSVASEWTRAGTTHAIVVPVGIDLTVTAAADDGEERTRTVRLAPGEGRELVFELEASTDGEPR